MTTQKKKIIVLDTSVLLYDKKSLENFPGCDVVLPLVVLDELDRFKDRPGLLGENARYINRYLDGLRHIGYLHSGVSVENGQTITIRLVYPDIPDDFPLDVNDGDNRILLEALQIQSGNPEQEVIIVSKDINLRVKCDAVGLAAEDYYSDYIDLPEESWSGVCDIELDGESIDAIYKNNFVSYDSDMSHNTFVVAKNSMTKQSVLCIWDAAGSKLKLVKDARVKTGPDSNFSAKNKEQVFAMYALMNEGIPLVTLTGLAGSGKTFLCLLSGISQVQQGKYERIVITRNIQPVGKEIGFLPGDVNEKMLPWMAPIIDNLRSHFKDKGMFDVMRVNGLIEVAPLSYIRGRTFTNSFIIIDESQNAVLPELRVAITRVGEGSKVVLMGDTDQIDTPYINETTNGLSIVAKRMRESLHTAHIHLPVGIRSTIATEASQML